MASVYLDNKLVKQTDWKPLCLPVCLPVCVCVSRRGDGVGVPGQQAGETDRLEANQSTCLSTCLCVSV